MLLQFKIRNFRSIRDEVVIDFTPSSKIKKSDLPNNIIKKGKYSAVSSLILYGRNASGKSNILKAFKQLVDMVTKSDSNKYGKPLRYIPYLFDADFQNQATEFEITFVSRSGIKYIYGIKFNSASILNENLCFFNEGKKTRLFTREKNNIKRGKYLKGNLKSTIDEMLDNQLFLSLLARKKIDYINEVYLYFSFDLMVTQYETDEMEEIILRFYSNMLMSVDVFDKNVKKLLAAADTNIIDYQINMEGNIEIVSDLLKERSNQNFRAIVKKRMPQLMDSILYKTKIHTYHFMFKGNTKQEELKRFDFNEESLGTKKLYSMAVVIISKLITGTITIVDELDKSLHPLLTRMLIGLFHSRKNNPHGAQLVFATHDATLLDNELFRRDQIMFVEKGYEGATEVYKMSDMTGVRDNIPYDKWYLSGRFKAVPIISEVELEF